MSVASATKNFTDGAEFFDQEKYQSTVTTASEFIPNQMAEAFKRPLSQCIIPIHSPTENIDGESPLDNVIDRSTSKVAFPNIWIRVKEETEEKRWIWTVALIVAVVTTIGGVVAPSSFGPILFVIGLVSVIVSAVFTYNTHSSYYEVQNQMAWFNKV